MKIEEGPKTPQAGNKPVDDRQVESSADNEKAIADDKRSYEENPQLKKWRGHFDAFVTELDVLKKKLEELPGRLEADPFVASWTHKHTLSHVEKSLEKLRAIEDDLDSPVPRDKSIPVRPQTKFLEVSQVDIDALRAARSKRRDLRALLDTAILNYVRIHGERP